MEVLDVLMRCGGVADARTLVAFCSRRRLSAAVASGQVVRDARGQRGEGWDHEALGRRLKGSHAQAPRDRVGLLEGGLGDLEPFEHPARVRREQPAGVRQEHATADPFEQLPAGLGFQSCELLGHRGPRVVERRRHGGDRAALLELDEEP